MATAIVVGFMFIIAGMKPLAKGLVLGTLFSIINFILIGETLPKRLSSSRKKASFIAFGSVIFRYALMTIPVVTALRYPEYNLWAAIAGIFMVQIMILTDHSRNSFFFNRYHKER